MKGFPPSTEEERKKRGCPGVISLFRREEKKGKN